MSKENRIYNLVELRVMATQKKSVVVPRHPGWVNPKPAAFVINLPGSLLLNLLASGMYVYEKRPQINSKRRS